MLKALYKSVNAQNTLEAPGRGKAMTYTLKPTWADEGPKRMCKLAPCIANRLLFKSCPQMRKRSPA